MSSRARESSSSTCPPCRSRPVAQCGTSQPRFLYALRGRRRTSPLFCKVGLGGDGQRICRKWGHVERAVLASASAQCSGSTFGTPVRASLRPPTFVAKAGANAKQVFVRGGSWRCVFRRSWILRQKWPPSSRRRPPRSSSTSTHPSPRRASTTSPSTRWTPRRCRRAASPLPGAYKPCLPDAPLPPPALLSSAPLTAEATLHRRGRAPPRRGTKVILTDLRKHDDLNGEVGFIVYKPDDRFDGAPVPRNPARPPGHRLRQGIKPARRHVRTLRRAPLHPRARRSVTLRSAPRAARAGASTTTRCSRSSTASSRSSD